MILNLTVPHHGRLCRTRMQTEKIRRYSLGRYSLTCEPCNVRTLLRDGPDPPRKCVLGDTLPKVLTRFAKTSRDGRCKNNSGCPWGSSGALCWGRGA